LLKEVLIYVIFKKKGFFDQKKMIKAEIDKKLAQKLSAQKVQKRC